MITQQQLEQRLAVIVAELETKMPPGVGFTFVMYDYGQAGSLAYGSTASRPETIALLTELIGVLGSRP
jgi:hypothetical protein